MKKKHEKPSQFPQPKTGYKLKFVLMSLGVLVLAEAFLLGLGLISFKNNQLAFYTSHMRVYAQNFSETVSMALRFGKSLEKFLGMDDLMADVVKVSGNIDNVEIFSQKGDLLYALYPDVPRTDIHGLTQEITEQASYYRFKFPLKKLDSVTGSAVFSFKRDRVDREVSKALNAGFKPIGYSIIAVLLILLPALRLFLGRENKQIPKLRIISVVFVSILLCQAFYTYFTVWQQVTTYKKMAFEVAEDSARIHRDDIVYLNKKGITLDELTGMNARLKRSVEALPEVASLSIVDKNKKERYHWGDTAAQFDLRLSLSNGGEIVAGLDRNYIVSKAKEMVLDSLTVMGLSLLFVTELTIFLLIYINICSTDDKKDRHRYALGYIRTAIALYLFGSMLGISFIPVFMNELTAGKSYFGLSGNLLTSIPVSTEILAALISSFIAGGWMDRSGWHKPFLSGIALSILAAFLSSMATDPVFFVLFRSLAGFGYGLSWMSAQGFLFNASQGKNLGRGSASLIAGIYSGYICGGAVGGLIADRLGYAAVFRFSGVILVFPAIFVFYFMHAFFKKPEHSAQETHVRDSFGKARTYLSNKTIASILVFCLLPFSLAQMGMFLFATPVVLDALHVSKATTGRVMMIYGITIIYLGPFLGSLTDRLSNKRLFLVIAGFSGTLGLFMVKYLNGVLAISMALFLMSVAGSIANPAISVLVHAQDVTRRVGVGFAVGTQRVFDKLGQMLGPLALGTLFSFYSFQTSIQILGAFYLFATLCYIAVNRRLT